MRKQSQFQIKETTLRGTPMSCTKMMQFIVYGQDIFMIYMNQHKQVHIIDEIAEIDMAIPHAAKSCQSSLQT